jgi:trigger factor
MSVILSVEDVGPCRKQLKIEVPAPAVAAETERVIGEFRKRAKLPGFRPGKVPGNIVRQRFKKEIEQEVVERLVPRYWHQAEAEQKLDPLLAPELQDVDLTLGEAMTFTAVVETRPEIDLGEGYRNLQLPDVPVEPTEEEIERQMEELRKRVGTWKAVERPAGRGDRVAVEITEGSGEPQKTSFEVGDERIWEELSLAVTGLAPNQQSSFRRRAAEGEEPKDYKVRVDTIEELELAPADDELAKKVSRFQTLAELREAVVESLRRARRRERRRQRENAMLQQLRDRHPLTLPEGVVQQETENMVREYAHQLAHQGVDIENVGIDWAELAERARPDAQRMVHSRLLLDALAEREGVEVPEEKLEALLADIARERKSTPLSVRRELDQSGRLASLRRQLRRSEAVTRIIGDEDEGELQSAAAAHQHEHHHHDHEHGHAHDHDHEHEHP